MWFYGDSLYNQSHYTGRTGMVSVGKEVTLAVKVKNRLKRNKRNKSTESEGSIQDFSPQIPPSRRAVAGRYPPNV